MPRRSARSQSLFPEPDEEGADGDFRPQTQMGYPMDEAISAMQKAIRRGREKEALFWAHELWPRWPNYFWRRIMIITSEDCAGDPMTPVIIQALYQNAFLASKEFKGRVEGHIEAHAVLVLSRSMKSREPADAKNVVQNAKEQGFRIKVPDYAVDKHTGRGKLMGKTMQDFEKTGRLIAGTQGRNEFAATRWGGPYPHLPRPGEKGADPDIVFPRVIESE